MAVIAIVGGQWGDEGKGKIVDLETRERKIKYVVRFSGGDNAGHSVKRGKIVYKFRLLPSGILYPDVINIIANGVDINPKVLVGEIDELESNGHKINLRVSGNAHLIMPYHCILDGIEGDTIDTTRKGIGPCCEDKYGRRGIRVCDLLEEEVFREKLSKNLEMKNLILTRIYNQQPLSFDEIFNEYLHLGERLRQYVCDTSRLLYEAQLKGENILYESAQGTMLDPNFGTYPYTTSTHPTIGGISIGIGSRDRVDRVIGVMKAYTTRVGGGPFPTELKDEIGEKLREIGVEFGTVTGRLRRCGWEDSVIVRYSSRINGIDEIAVTKLDVLDQFPTIKVCTAYNYGNDRIEDIYPGIDLAKCSPIYEELPGWLTGISDIRDYNRLPDNTKRYLSRLEDLSGARIGIISVGPEREQTIIR